MKIGELATAAGVTRDTIRHYLALGLIHARRNPDNGYQIFDASVLARLRFIRTARELGFHLGDIKQIFADADNHKSPCPRVRDLMEQRIAETRDTIARLTALCDRMEKAVAQWRMLPDSVPDGLSVCRLIEANEQGAGMCTERINPPSKVHREMSS